MKLSKLSNKTLFRFIDELRGAMEIAANTLQIVEYETLEKLYNEAMAEFRQRTEALGDFERLKPNGRYRG